MSGAARKKARDPRAKKKQAHQKQTPTEHNSELPNHAVANDRENDNNTDTHTSHTHTAARTQALLKTVQIFAAAKAKRAHNSSSEPLPSSTGSQSQPQPQPHTAQSEGDAPEQHCRHINSVNAEAAKSTIMSPDTWPCTGTSTLTFCLNFIAAIECP